MIILSEVNENISKQPNKIDEAYVGVYAYDMAIVEDFRIRFNYKKDGKLHVVHFDDACSINSKINLAIDENIKGLSIWTVTTYFPQLILLIDYYFNIEK